MHLGLICILEQSRLRLLAFVTSVSHNELSKQGRRWYFADPETAAPAIDQYGAVQCTTNGRFGTQSSMGSSPPILHRHPHRQLRDSSHPDAHSFSSQKRRRRQPDTASLPTGCSSQPNIPSSACRRLDLMARQLS